MVTRVCVIGAGAGGLCAVRHLKRFPEKLSVVCYEQAPVLGGTWVYNENTGRDHNDLPIHSSMYRNLRTNLPKEVMAFPDFPFSKSLPSFLTHHQVLLYLDNYASHFGLNQHIQLNTVVDRVERLDKSRWSVTVRDTQSKVSESHEFAAIIVCNGHYSVPIMPKIPGLDNFSGRCIHSHDYRHPEEFSGQTVLLLGAGASGTDIAVDMAPHAKTIYLAHNRPAMTTKLPENVEQAAGLARIDGRQATLRDGRVLEVDSLLLCTGYHYTFPFLTGDCTPSVDAEEHVSPLFMHLFHIDYPELSFIGIPKKICPFPLFDCQMQLISAVLRGEITLPPAEEMRRDTEGDFLQRLSDGLPARHAHTMGTRQWGYNDHLATFGNFSPIPRVVRTLYDAVHGIRTVDLTSYKNKEFRLIDDNCFEEAPSAKQ